MNISFIKRTLIFLDLTEINMEVQRRKSTYEPFRSKSENPYQLRKTVSSNYSEGKKKHPFQRDPTKSTILIRYDYGPTAYSSDQGRANVCSRQERTHQTDTTKNQNKIMDSSECNLETNN